ncbi:hypothetical protein LX36DRAFT_364892 [Colletotrichum falcatum]|nr:hypothetical protein LX36DRAFT_364892 [Colletotrichum falcatum]
MPFCRFSFFCVGLGGAVPPANGPHGGGANPGASGFEPRSVYTVHFPCHDRANPSSLSLSLSLSLFFSLSGTTAGRKYDSHPSFRLVPAFREPGVPPRNCGGNIPCQGLDVSPGGRGGGVAEGRAAAVPAGCSNDGLFFTLTDAKPSDHSSSVESQPDHCLLGY